MNKEINNNGYDYVDLELPSGTKWATMNVGAKKPLESGLYFQWGNVQGYTKDQVGKDKQFSWIDYKFSINGSDENFNKYAKDGATLDLKDDAAHANMGGDWHMPSPTQIQELINNTKSAWAKQNGINGRLFTSKRNPSKSIFIPAAGGSMDGLVLNSDRYGLTWPSMLTIFLVRFAKSICFNSEDIYLSYNFSSRCNGFSARGVIG